jgi:5-amino-6-(5-phospho-D-ribitylamino)uracil phosphatase
MPGKSYKLLVIDIDGTLVNKHGLISDKDTEALMKAVQAGITVAMSTGRVVQASKWILDKLSLGGYHIFFDGALVVNPDTSHELYVEPIAQDMVKQLVEFAHKTHLHFDFYSSQDYFIEREDWLAEVRREFFRLTPVLVDFSSIWQKERIIKGTLVVHTDEERAIARDIQRYFDGKLLFSWTNAPRYPDIDFINVIDPRVSKGKALLKLCSSLGILPAEVMAIGDGSNDVSLLQSAGLAVAMGNAKQGLKDIAHHVTLDIEQSGVAIAIEKFLL